MPTHVDFSPDPANFLLINWHKNPFSAKKARKDSYRWGQVQSVSSST
jgi:hypothetical protein